MVMMIVMMLNKDGNQQNKITINDNEDKANDDHNKNNRDENNM